MISLTNHDFQWGRSEVVIIYPEVCKRPDLSESINQQVTRQARPKLAHVVRWSKPLKKWLFPYFIYTEKKYTMIYYDILLYTIYIHTIYVNLPPIYIYTTYMLIYHLDIYIYIYILHIYYIYVNLPPIYIYTIFTYMLNLPGGLFHEFSGFLVSSSDLAQ